MRTLPVFFGVLELLLRAGVTTVAEAAFQDQVWRPRLTPLLTLARVRVVQCVTDPDVAARRVLRRRAEDDTRRAHADPGQADAAAYARQLAAFDRVRLDVPSIEVDTTAGCRPGLAEVVAFASGLPADLRRVKQAQPAPVRLPAGDLGAKGRPVLRHRGGERDVAPFRGAHPGVAVTLAEDESAALIERVRSGTADLALIGAPGAPPSDLEALTVASERLTAAAAPGHPLLAGRAEVTLADLAGYPVACLPGGTGIRATLDASCAAAGVRLDVALEASAPGTVADLAARGLGVAVLSESMAAAHSARLRAVPVSDAVLPAVLALVWKPGPGPAAREFLRCCREAFPAGRGQPSG